MPRLTHRPPGLPRRQALARGLAMVLATAALPGRAAAADAKTESQLKAAFVYKFLSYIEWPAASFAQPDSPVVIGVCGADALAEELGAVVAARTIDGRPLTVRVLRRDEALSGLHVLFIGKAAEQSAQRLAEAKDHALLTVTESPQAFALGSAINFVLVDDKVRFDVSLRAAEAANLKISSRLLAVARKVIGANT
jgi:hypothetical protein